LKLTLALASFLRIAGVIAARAQAQSSLCADCHFANPQSDPFRSTPRSDHASEGSGPITRGIGIVVLALPLPSPRDTTAGKRSPPLLRHRRAWRSRKPSSAETTTRSLVIPLRARIQSKSLSDP
jgi:hypothetical protein